MATSGTIGTTTLSVAQMLEHAFRRCGVPPSKIAPEDEVTARESLFMLMVSLANRGINLWCVDKKILGFAADQATYALPAGTLDVLNWIHSTPTRETGTDTATATTTKTELTEATKLARYGFKPTASFTGTVVLAGSDDDITYTTITSLASATFSADTWYWYDLDPLPEYTYYRLTTGVAATMTEFYLASNVRDINIAQWNRDDWAAQPSKSKSGSPATNVYFEKLVSPQFTLWPVPDSDYNHLSIWRHRQIQDVGDLTNELELPTRWFEHITWQLSFRVACEVPGADARLQFLSEQVKLFQIEAESNETDNAPIYLSPAIGVYTR